MAGQAPAFHTPVLGPETADQLVTDPRGVYVDATLGGGGHAEHLLKRIGEEGRLIGVDRDPEAIAEASRRLAGFGDRLRTVQAPFWELPHILEDLSVSRAAGMLFDLGVSSHQIDDPERGFSYQQDGPLDMRMGPDAPRTAHEVVNTYSQAALTRVLKTYGEERASGRIARAICRHREEDPLTRTWELRNLVAEVTGGAHLQKTLSRIFQAIRIEVNEELSHLQSVLEQAVEALQPGGRIAVLSYHSLEDRCVKQVFREAAKGCICPPDLPVCGCGREPTLKILTPRGIRPAADERARNPRARSAALRVGQRLSGGT